MNRRTSLAGFVLLAVLWGASYPAIKAGLAGFPPVLFAAARFDLIGLFVLLYAALAPRLPSAWSSSSAEPTPRVLPRRGDLPGIVVGGSLLVGLHNGLMFTGQGYVTSAVSAVILSTIPVLSAAFSLVLLPEERVSAPKLAGICLGLVGVGIIASPDPNNLLSSDFVGVGILLAAAAAFALGGVCIQRFRTDLPVASMQGWMMLLGAALLHAGSLALGETQGVDLTMPVLLAFVYLVPFAGVVGYLLYFVLLDSLGSVEINLVGYVAPVFAAIVGWALLSESISARTWLGFAVICVAFVLVKRRALARELGWAET